MVCTTHTLPLLLYWQDHFTCLSSFQCFFLIYLPGSCLCVLRVWRFLHLFVQASSRTLLEYSRKITFQLLFSTSLLAIPCTHPAWLSCFPGDVLLFSFSLNNFSCCLESFPPFSSKWEPSGALFGIPPTGFGQEQEQGQLPAPYPVGCWVRVEQQLLFLPPPHAVFVTGKTWLLLQLLLNSHPAPFLADLNWGWGKGHINNKSINF